MGAVQLNAHRVLLLTRKTKAVLPTPVRAGKPEVSATPDVQESVSRGLPPFSNSFHIVPFGKNGKNCTEVLKNFNCNVVMYLKCFKMFTAFAK